jgi:hypothetical protein
MDYSTMSLVELKQVAKGRKIKLYYVLPKEELVRLLSLPELPLELRLQKKTIRQLRQEAKERNLTGFWGLSRGELLTLLYPDQQGSANKNEKDQRDAHEHNSPEKHCA